MGIPQFSLANRWKKGKFFHSPHPDSTHPSRIERPSSSLRNPSDYSWWKCVHTRHYFNASLPIRVSPGGRPFRQSVSQVKLTSSMRRVCASLITVPPPLTPIIVWWSFFFHRHSRLWTAVRSSVIVETNAMLHEHNINLPSEICSQKKVTLLLCVDGLSM